MSDKLTNSALPKSTFLAQPHALRDILITASPVIFLGILGNLVGLSTFFGGALINLGYVLMMVVGGIILYRQQGSWRHIGLKQPKNWFRTFLFGVAAFIGALFLFVAMQAVAVSLLTTFQLVPSELDQSRFNPFAGNLSLYLLSLALAWTSIAFGEEMFFRAFLISRLIDIAKRSNWLAILISAVAFGSVHFAEGSVGILSNGAFGVLFGWIYVRSQRNLWITIIAHGLINTLRFTLVYGGAV